MYFEAALLALLLGLLLGGSLKKLLEIRLRLLGLLLVSAAMSVLPQLPVIGGALAGFGQPASVLIACVRYVSLLIFVGGNLRQIPVCIIGAGGISNFSATLANGGRMPVASAALGVNPKDGGAGLLKSGMIVNYQVAGGHTRLRPLCDIIQARGFYIYFLSVGDILISLGIMALILQVMQPKRMVHAAERMRSVFKRGAGEKPHI